MNQNERDIQRKLRILRHAEQIGDVCKTCRYFGIARGSFYRWRAALQRHGTAGLANRKPVPRNPANRTPVCTENSTRRRRLDVDRRR